MLGQDVSRILSTPNMIKMTNISSNCRSNTMESKNIVLLLQTIPLPLVEALVKLLFSEEITTLLVMIETKSGCKFGVSALDVPSPVLSTGMFNVCTTSCFRP